MYKEETSQVKKKEQTEELQKDLNWVVQPP